MLAFFLIISWLMYQLAVENETRTTFDSLLPLLVLTGVVITRVMQASSEARRLAHRRVLGGGCPEGHACGRGRTRGDARAVAA